MGKEFFLGVVRELLPEGARPSVPAILMSLVRKEFIRPDRSTLPGEDMFRFRHLLIRDAAYEALPKSMRADLHERTAGWIEGIAGERIAEQEEILGYHLERAYGYLLELGTPGDRSRELAARASEHLATAGGEPRTAGTSLPRAGSSSGPHVCAPPTIDLGFGSCSPRRGASSTWGTTKGRMPSSVRRQPAPGRSRPRGADRAGAGDAPTDDRPDRGFRIRRGRGASDPGAGGDWR